MPFRNSCHETIFAAAFILWPKWNVQSVIHLIVIFVNRTVLLSGRQRSLNPTELAVTVLFENFIDCAMLYSHKQDVIELEINLVSKLSFNRPQNYVTVQYL